MNKRPILILLLFFGMGILVQDKFVLTGFLVYSIIAFSLLLVGIFYLFPKLSFEKYKAICLWIIFLGVGVFSHFLHSKSPPLFQFSGKQNIRFELSKKLNSSDKNRRYEANAFVDEQPVKMLLNIPKTFEELDFKHSYASASYINAVQPAQHSFQFDYQKYLARKEIYFQAYLSEGFSKAEKSQMTFTDKIQQNRIEVLKNIENSSLQTKNKEFLKGIILADRTEMDEETVSNFTKTGLVHILAISGSHMAIIFWMILLVLKPIFSAKQRNVPIIISVVVIWIFAIFIDFGSSVVRSCLMITMYYLMVFLKRKPDFLHAMALSALIILIIDTQQLFDVGFQLSYLAVLGIYWLNPAILYVMPTPKNKIQKFLMNVFSMSIAAQVATLPLVLYYFHQFSLLSVFINLIAIPIAEVVIIFSFVMTLLLGFNIEISWVINLYDWASQFFLQLIDWFAQFDFGFIKGTGISVPEVIIVFVLIYMLRLLVLQPSITTRMNFAFLIILFFALRLGFNFHHQQKEEVLTHQFFKEKIISVKFQNQIIYFMDEKVNQQKIIQYIIEPYNTYRRTGQFQINFVDTQDDVLVNGVRYSFR